MCDEKEEITKEKKIFYLSKSVRRFVFKQISGILDQQDSISFQF